MSINITILKDTTAGEPSSGGNRRKKFLWDPLRNRAGWPGILSFCPLGCDEEKFIQTFSKAASG